ncbi:hypothetical protein GJAV_G00258150 [Gymnothorax javanicus]|nr:hypothetical protein GJAV_G00258150 [Gymnothorax javanicus]
MLIRHRSTPLKGPSLVGLVKKDWVSQNTIALSWQEPKLPSVTVVDYEVKYYEKEHAQLSYSSTRTKTPSTIIAGLKPATRYVFSVRAFTSSGYSTYSPAFEFETGDESSDMAADQGQVLVIVTAAVGGFALLVILTLFFLITGRFFSMQNVAAEGFLYRSEDRMRIDLHNCAAS